MKRNIQSQQGQALMIAIVLFTMVSMTMLIGVAGPTVKEAKNTNDFFRSRGGYFLAEGGTEDALYRIKNGYSVPTGDTVSLNDQTAVIHVVNSSDAKTITVEGEDPRSVRKVESVVRQGVGAAFNYGIQVGNGGFELTGGSRINGNVYSMGSVHGDGSNGVSGSVTVAGSIPSVANQINDTPTTPPNTITFGNANATQDAAQSFKVTTTDPLKTVQLYIKKVGLPANITVNIVADNGGKPNTTSLTSGVLSASSVTTNFGWVEVAFTTNPDRVLSVGTTYWIVLDTSTGSASKNYIWAANTTYVDGLAKVKNTSGTVWNNTSPSGLDGYFRLFAGGNSTQIYGDGGDKLSIGGDAWAHTVIDTTTTGTIYCQAGTGNNKTCNTSRADPASVSMPISDSMIAQWKSEAEEGGTQTGNVSIGWAGGSLGPKKIIGNLSVSGGGTLTVTGTLWVTGTVTTSGGGKIKLSSLYGDNSGAIVTDKYVSLTGDGNFQGSGQPHSFPLLVVTSDCPVSSFCSGNSAITISGGSGSVILSAQNGTVSVSGGSSAKSITGNKVVMTGGATLNYDMGISDLNFSSGPSGGWELNGWKEVQ
ncbi:MAG: choice-of-anchor R domain-containing protein [Candidatus Paceibacterota bacterium]